jgi:hypothetical protein
MDVAGSSHGIVTHRRACAQECGVRLRPGLTQIPTPVVRRLRRAAVSIDDENALEVVKTPFVGTGQIQGKPRPGAGAVGRRRRRLLKSTALLAQPRNQATAKWRYRGVPRRRCHGQAPSRGLADLLQLEAP